MVKKITNTVFTLIFLGLLISPHLVEFFEIKIKKLNGYIPKVQKYEISVENYLNGDFQKQFEKYQNTYFNLKPVLSRVDNQINLSVFNETSIRNHRGIIIGKDGVFFERSYIEEINTITPNISKHIENIVLKLKTLKANLKKNNTELLVLISPSKARVYQHLIPSIYLKTQKSQSKEVIFEKHLKKHNIPFLNVPRIFKNKLRQEKKDSFLLFAPTGTHWSYGSLCITLPQLQNKIAKLINKEIYNIKCLDLKKRKQGRAEDIDLLMNANLLFEDSYNLGAYYSKVKTIKNSSSAIRPRVLFVGSSFVWEILRLSDKKKLYSERDFYYYFDTKTKNHTSLDLIKIDKANLNIKEILSKKDIVIIEINEAAVLGIGNGFVEYVNSKL